MKMVDGWVVYVGIYITDILTAKNALPPRHPAEPKARTKNHHDVLSRGFRASIHLGTALTAF